MNLDIKTQKIDFKEFIIGTHGITIYFSNNENATYLANVLPESLNITQLKNDTWNELVE